MTSPQQHTEELSTDEVRHIAALCRIGLTADEADRMRRELTTLLNEVRVIQATDTTEVQPTGHAVEVDSVMRADVPGPVMPVEEVLGNTPKREGDYIRVRAVIEE
jgi:aspartyl-tRNA(Asn)/glutamyl-tRNA(Gln) amidotransferase subunit C